MVNLKARIFISKIKAVLEFLSDSGDLNIRTMRLLLLFCLAGLAVGGPVPEATPSRLDEAQDPQEGTDKKSDAPEATPFAPKDQEREEPKHEGWEDAFTFLESLMSNQEPKNGSPEVSPWKAALLSLSSSLRRPDSIGPNQDGTRFNAEEEKIIRQVGQEMYTYNITRDKGAAISMRLHNDPKADRGNSLVTFNRAWFKRLFGQRRVDPDTGDVWYGLGYHYPGSDAIIYDSNFNNNEGSLNINLHSDAQF